VAVVISGQRDLQLLNQEKAKYIEGEQTLKRLASEKKKLQETIKLSSGDDSYIKQLIHKNLGFVTEDEKILDSKPLSSD